MAGESARQIRRKRIKLPDGNTVDVPVISQISFIDANDRGWETQYTIDNTTDADRLVHVASILPNSDGHTDETGGGGTGGTDTGGSLQVERIDGFKVSDAADRGQETQPSPDSKTVQQPPDAPPYFKTHAKTRIVKYIKRNDDDTEDKNIWIKSELIDAISFLDANDRGQEHQFTLFNPPDNQDIGGLRLGTDDDGETPTISVDPSIEEITTGVGGSDDGDTPVRTDPFQNIVAISGHDVQVVIYYFGDMTVIPTPGEPLPGDLTDYISMVTWSIALVTKPAGFVYGVDPVIPNITLPDRAWTQYFWTQYLDQLDQPIGHTTIDGTTGGTLDATFPMWSWAWGSTFELGRGQTQPTGTNAHITWAPTGAHDKDGIPYHVRDIHATMQYASIPTPSTPPEPGSPPTTSTHFFVWATFEPGTA
jgi:hypothetical protein